MKLFNPTKLLTTSAVLGILMAQPITAAECGIESSTDKRVSYEFNDTELKSAVMLAGMAAGKEIIGLELLENKIISASAKEVNVVAFVDALLLVNGFGFEENQENWIITKM